MAEAWYEGLPDDALKTEKAKIYEKAEAIIREKLDRGLDFDAACADIGVEDEKLRKDVIDDMLKVLIGEEHFTKNVALEEMAKKLNVPLERLEKAKLEMLEDVKESSIKAFYKSLGHGNA
jgi:deoxyhypusine synthase